MASTYSVLGSVDDGLYVIRTADSAMLAVFDDCFLAIEDYATESEFVSALLDEYDCLSGVQLAMATGYYRIFA